MKLTKMQLDALASKITKELSKELQDTLSSRQEEIDQRQKDYEAAADVINDAIKDLCLDLSERYPRIKELIDEKGVPCISKHYSGNMQDIGLVRRSLGINTKPYYYQPDIYNMLVIETINTTDVDELITKVKTQLNNEN